MMTLPWRLIQQQLRLPLTASKLRVPGRSGVGGGAPVVSNSGWTRQFHDDVTSSSTTTIVGLAAAIVAAASVVAVSSTDLEKRNNNEAGNKSIVSYQMDIDFMDKLARKSYLHFADHNMPSRHRHKVSRGDDNDNDDASNDFDHAARPVGVPRNLRLLAVDLPELRQGFSGGECHVAADRVFPHGIAPSVMIQVPSSSQQADDNEQTSDTKSKKKKKKRRKNKKTKNNDADDGLLEVEQKAWVQSMFRCVHGNHQTVGVRVMEARTAALNPHNLVKTHPLLVGRTKSQQQQQQHDLQSQSQQQSSKVDVEHHDETKTKQPSSAKAKSRFTWGNQQDEKHEDSQDSKKAAGDDSSVVKDQEHREQQQLLIAAPWNQHAWREELELRISGQVVFGDTMQEASGWWNRYILGRVYQPTIPLHSSRGLSDWIFFWRRGSSSSRQRRQDEENSNEDDDEDQVVDGDLTQPHWSFHHKPHAVIANGSALQRVPHALRLLQKSCREHNVPLYVIGDPRKWGQSTNKQYDEYITSTHDHYDELGAVLRDLRRTLKRRIVTTSLQQQQVSGSRTAFQRGRYWGKLETNTYWESREAARKSRQVVDELLQSAKSLAATKEKQDWSHDDKATLEEKLIRHGVVRKENFPVMKVDDDDKKEEDDDDATSKRRRTKTMEERRIYSKAFAALAQQWVTDTQQTETKPAIEDDGVGHEGSSHKDDASPSVTRVS